MSYTTSLSLFDTLETRNTYQEASTMHIYLFRPTPCSFFIPFPFSHLLLISPTAKKMSLSQHPPDTPASIALVDAFARIMSCPYIDIAEIPEDERNCPICTDPYHHLNDQARERDLKVAQRLPCGHYLCNNCLYKWLSPIAESNNNTCPFDRRVFFPKFPPFLNTEGLQGRLDLVDWFNEAKGEQPLGVERDRIRGMKTMLVERRLGEAIEELEVDQVKAEGLMQIRISACEIDAAVLFAYNRELLQFEYRLTTIRAIAEIMVGYRQISSLRVRLQHMTDRLARDRAIL